MSELFDDEDKILVVETDVEVDDVEEIIRDNRQRPISDSRRRLENMLDEKRLRDELEDFLDY